jgi:hypothetical protein
MLGTIDSLFNREGCSVEGIKLLDRLTIAVMLIFSVLEGVYLTGSQGEN